GGIAIGPERFHRVKCPANALRISIAVLNDDALDGVGMFRRNPVADRGAIVLNIDAELFQAQVLEQKILDMGWQIIEGIFELLHTRSVTVAEAQIVRSNDMKLVRQLRYQVTKHVG